MLGDKTINIFESYCMVQMGDVITKALRKIVWFEKQNLVWFHFIQKNLTWFEKKLCLKPGYG